MKKEISIKMRDWKNHIARMCRGFRNRQTERSADHPRRKVNCRKLTLGRLRYRDLIGA